MNTPNLSATDTAGTGNTGEAWREYETWIDLYKHHLDLALRFNILYFGLTSAFVAFVLTWQDTTQRKCALVFTIAVSVLFSVFWGFAAKSMTYPQQRMRKLSRALGIEVAPKMDVLTLVVWLAVALQAVVAICSVVYMFLPHYFPYSTPNPANFSY